MAQLSTLGSIRTMKPTRVISVAAGITLIFAVTSLATNAWSAYMMRHMISAMKPTGDEFTTMQSYQSANVTAAVECFVLTLLQIAIIFYARKISRQNHAA